MSETVNNGPIASRQFDRVQVAVWENHSEPDGSGRWYSITIVRRYRDANGEWQSTSSFTERDLPHVKRGVDWAEARIAELTS